MQEHIVPIDQGGEALGVRLPLLPARDVPPGHGVLPVVQQLTPGVVRVVVTRQDWEAVTHLPAKDSHGGGHLGVWVRGVPV